MIAGKDTVCLFLKGKTPIATLKEKRITLTNPL
jgi:hypothetical protein